MCVYIIAIFSLASSHRKQTITRASPLLSATFFLPFLKTAETRICGSSLERRQRGRGRVEVARRFTLERAPLDSFDRHAQICMSSSSFEIRFFERFRPLLCLFSRLAFDPAGGHWSVRYYKRPLMLAARSPARRARSDVQHSLIHHLPGWRIEKKKGANDSKSI